MPIFNVLSTENSELKIIFPEDMNTIKGKVILFRPSDSKLDKSFKLKENVSQQSFNISTLPKGKWVVKVSWTDNNIDYYVDKKIFL